MKFFSLDDLSKITFYKVTDTISEYQFLYNFISINKDFILENCSTFSYEDLWYNEYYWLLCEKYLRYKEVSFDAGLEQMLFKLLETVSNEIDIDWNIIKDLETKAKKLILE